MPDRQHQCEKCSEHYACNSDAEVCETTEPRLCMACFWEEFGGCG